MSYADLLRDPRWQRKRLEVMQRADFHCEACGTDRVTLNVHHAEYVRGRMPWEYDASELYCLCEECHAKAHGIETAESRRRDADLAARRRKRWELWQQLTAEEQSAALRMREIDIAIPVTRDDPKALDALVREKMEVAAVLARSAMGRRWRAFR